MIKLIPSISSSLLTKRFTTNIRFNIKTFHPYIKRLYTVSPNDHSNKDALHFFSSAKNSNTPSSYEQPSTRSTSPQAIDLNIIQKSVIRQKSKNQRKVIFSSFLIIIFSSLIGYTICYKILFCKEDSSWPIYIHFKDFQRNVSNEELQNLDLISIKRLAEKDSLLKISLHNMIKEDYKIPLEVDEAGTELFTKLWVKEKGPSITFVKFAPKNKNKEDAYVKGDSTEWHSFLGLFKYKIQTEHISSLPTLANTLDLFQLIPGKETDDDSMYKYQAVPPTGSSNEEDEDLEENKIKHPRVWFIGEFKLREDGSLIIYRGNYHTDVNILEIDLLRNETSDIVKENTNNNQNQLVRYVLYKDTKD
ncbi:Aim39p SCDLUD_001236 [Saccharomycodes ludwigii]|uniref:Aim39p n=1 Tax=Saccharomycodes ludwigii TaxID=36035 RepID=UPI001E897D9E|nr:hypothetical protein SCDLUD_001236 [Saccharomycodes ludwigii]KAH3903592.1 hypothetical protein SCDLUD_001236 [Saccharomycodes ludwigii]